MIKAWNAKAKQIKEIKAMLISIMKLIKCKNKTLYKHARDNNVLLFI
jgi:hypothetical protein